MKILRTVMTAAAVGLASLAATPGIAAAAPSSNQAPYDSTNACSFLASVTTDTDASGNPVLIATTDTESGYSSSCPRTWGGSGKALVQIVCDNGSSATQYYSNIVSSYASTIGAGSCYSRHRVSRTGLQGSYGTEYRIPWSPAGGWGQGYYA
jgi:hypothetical protein